MIERSEDNQPACPDEGVHVTLGRVPKKCPHCGQTIYPEKFCPVCGEPITMEMQIIAESRGYEAIFDKPSCRGLYHKRKWRQGVAEEKAAAAKPKRKKAPKK